MQRVTSLGRTFFAAALIGLGIEHFLFQKFVAGHLGEAPAPTAVSHPEHVAQHPSGLGGVATCGAGRT